MTRLSYGGIIYHMTKNRKSSKSLGQEVSSQSPHLNKEWLYQKYVVEGLSTYQIGKLVSRNPKNIYNKLKEFGIPTRTRAEEIIKNAWWNLGLAHPGKGKHRSEETKAKISKARKGKEYPNLQGEKNGMFGNRSPNWKGGVTPERQKLYGTRLWKEIVKTVFERDKFLCQRCHKPNRSIHAHHIKSWADYPNNRFDLDNLITVCKECHHWIHSSKNTNKDFLD